MQWILLGLMTLLAPNPVPDAKVSFAASAPMVEVGSSLIFGSGDVL